jgi:hexokinase
MSDYLRKFEGLFTLTPQRMRMIVEAFEEALEKGLSAWDQCVVRTIWLLPRLFRSP